MDTTWKYFSIATNSNLTKHKSRFLLFDNMFIPEISDNKKKKSLRIGNNELNCLGPKYVFTNVAQRRDRKKNGNISQ